eukprot:c12669_g2_i1 orf=2-226(-)
MLPELPWMFVLPIHIAQSVHTHLWQELRACKHSAIQPYLVNPSPLRYLSSLRSTSLPVTHPLLLFQWPISFLVNS